MNTAEYEAILVVAAVLEEEGNYIAALNEYERAINADYKRPEAYLKAAKLLLRGGGVWRGYQQVVPVNRAVQYLKDALRWNRDNVSILELLFQAQKSIGRLHEAVLTASKLIDLSPEKEHWHEQALRTFVTLQDIPYHMNLLAVHIGSEGINQLRKKLTEDLPFFAVLDALAKDEPDLIHINNCNELLQANLMSPGPEQVTQLKDLHSRYPESGNVCVLYANALVETGQKAEAISVAKIGIKTVKCKSQVAAFLGHAYLWDGNLGDCVRWYIAAAVLESSHRSKPQFTFAYLACLYSAVGAVRNRRDFELTAQFLAIRADVFLLDDLKQKILAMAHTQSDHALENIMEQAARRYGWMVTVTDSRPAKERQIEREAYAGLSLGPEIDPLVTELIEIGLSDGFLSAQLCDKFNENRQHMGARRIGQLLNEKGGKELMQAVWYRVRDRLGPGLGSELEECWHEIGDWLA